MESLASSKTENHGAAMNNDELLADVVAEALDLSEKLQKTTDLINLLLSQGEVVPMEQVHGLFRLVHTLKGLMQIGGFEAVLQPLHATEDLIADVRSTGRPFTLEDLLAVEETIAVCEGLIGASSVHATEVTGDLPASMAPADTDEALSAEENVRVLSFLGRSELLFAALLPAADGVAALETTEAVDALRRSCDVLLVRPGTSHSLVVFGSELDGSIVEAIVECPLVELPKSKDLFTVLPPPWNALRLDGSVEEIAVAAEVVADVTLAKDVAPPGSTAVVEMEFEDFDSRNLAQPPMPLSDLDPEMVADFLTNVEELLDALSASILELEANPGSTDAIEKIFRTAHTIKGTAGMFGFRAIERLTHVMENKFDKVRKGQLVATPAVVDSILFGFDRVRELFASLQAGQTPEAPINDALARLQMAETGVALPMPAPVAIHAAPQSPQSHPAGAPPDGSSFPAASAGKPAAESGKTEQSGGTIRVDLKRLDGLVNLVGELVIDRTRFLQIEEELRTQSTDSDLVHIMSEAVLLFGRHMNEVQNIIMKIRMVPIGNAFLKFNRVVRDLARECKKEIELHVDGGEAELDKTLVEEIADPLIHLVRNSVDHGIELPDDRAAKGKPRRGNIRLSARQDGNMIVIQVMDDGKGLQLERIHAKAIKQELIKESDHLTRKEMFNLIFEPGFSTAEQVTNISGRGVGMDVVKRNIVKLKGVIDLDSEVDKGTTVTIKLPLTLAIIPSLMVEACGESYAIPLVNVIESIRIGPEEAQRIGNSDFVKLRNRALPLFRLSGLFGLDEISDRLWYRIPAGGTKRLRQLQKLEKSPEEGGGQIECIDTSARVAARRGRAREIFVVVGVGEKRMGLIVDQLLGQQEIVIKSLGPMVTKPDGIAGACVLGNGRVALVLDVGEIVERIPRSAMTASVLKQMTEKEVVQHDNSH